MSLGRKCCMPGCRSNYDTETAYTPVFQFPKNEARRNQWINYVKRENFNPSKTAVICALHFEDRFLIKEDSVTRKDGSLLVVPRNKWALNSDAYPTKFPNCPTYVTKVLPLTRKSPSKRHEAMVARDDEQFDQWLQNDVILSFDQFVSKFSSESPCEWKTSITPEYALFYRIKETECPKIVVSFKVLCDLSIKIWHSDTEVCSKSVKSVLGNDLKCDRWTKFDCLLSMLSQYDIKEQSVAEKLSTVAEILELCMETAESEVCEKLAFLKEQVTILNMKQIRYSAKFLVWAAKFFYSFPAAYLMIRSCNVMTIPHPSYLKKLASALNVEGSPNSHVGYLKKKASLLKEHERIVNVLLDEIYITAAIDYKGGHLVGSADNTSYNSSIQTATTIQTFMIVSVFSREKDVVSLIPVKNINAEKLYSYTKDVLKILVDCGYTTLCLISDNNRVNRNMFLLMCYDGALNSTDSDPEESDTDELAVEPNINARRVHKKMLKPELKNFVQNPYCKGQKLFFLFDTPHLLKSVCNNWLNQKTIGETMYYPNPMNAKEVFQTCLADLKKMYEAEKSAIVKVAPKLSRKVLYPSSFERQSVLFATNLFHDSNTVALSMDNDSSTQGTKTFIDLISKWWKIVNVKHHEKGLHKRDIFCQPIRNAADSNIQFLREFSEWMETWGKLKTLKPKEKQNMNIPTRGGFLSNETQFSLHFTTNSLVEIVKYVFDEYTPKYLLLGKFQTDNLEGRFGQYRQMNGGNYSISCRQVQESEHKLKILSLINLHSEKVGDFKLKYFDCNGSDETTKLEIPELFYDALNTNDEDISTSTMSVIVYIAGYVAHQVTAQLKCKLCISQLVAEKPLECEISNDSDSKYLSLTTRGGLKWPQKLTVDIVVCTFGIFKQLISEKFEKEFVLHKKQKNLLVSLALEKLDLLCLIQERTCDCENKLIVLINKSLSVLANILLNNYAKVFNDIKKSNKRKLYTLN